jgi:nitroreductase
MDLNEAMRTTGTCRYFTPAPVPDEVLYQAFEMARFGPQGGNRQPVRWIVVRDEARKQAIQDLYLPMWRPYFAGLNEGSISANALPKTVLDADYFAEHLATVPAILVLCAELAGLHPTDNDLGRLSVVGGASIYPTMQNLCLALRALGVASAVTTLLCHQEPQMRELLDLPPEFITAAHVAVGYPDRGFPSKLTRGPVEEIVFLENFDTPMFSRAKTVDG